MKISKEQKYQNRRAILRATVGLVAEKGFRQATMREIARKAGIGDATIYNYFPTKETILTGYYEDHFRDCINRLQSMEELSEYTFREQVQTFFETSLELYLPDREFVARTFDKVFFSFSPDFRKIRLIRSLFVDIVGDMLEASVEAGEIPDQVFREVILQLFMDYYMAMALYWLSDTSEGFADTSVLIDKTLDLAVSMLSAGVANKVFDIAAFLFKNHVLSRLESLREHGDTVHRIKRRFMGGNDAGRNT